MTPDFEALRKLWPVADFDNRPYLKKTISVNKCFMLS
jgi:hypothetical protein